MHSRFNKIISAQRTAHSAQRTYSHNSTHKTLQRFARNGCRHLTACLALFALLLSCEPPSEKADIGGPTGAELSEGKSATKKLDGTTLKKLPDGTIVKTLPDGTTITTKPDGTTITKLPDGTTTTTRPDGTTITKLPDGTTTTTKPDGTTITKLPDGTTTTTRPDSTTETTRPDGTTITKLPDDTTITTKLDGTTETTRPDGTAIIDTPDGKKHLNIPDDPDKWKAVGKNAFEDIKLTSVTIPPSIRSIGSRAFASGDLEFVTIPPSVRSIEPLAFAYNATLKEVILPIQLYNRYVREDVVAGTPFFGGDPFVKPGPFAWSGAKYPKQGMKFYEYDASKPGNKGAPLN